MHPKESDQLRLDRNQGLNARSQVAHFDESIYSAQFMQPKESDKLRLDRHQGLSARSPVAHFDEFIYSTQVMQPKESNQLKLDRNQGLSAQSPVALFEEFVYSAQATQLMSLKVIYFQSIFLIDFKIKRPIYMQESGINFTKLLCSKKCKRKQKLQ